MQGQDMCCNTISERFDEKTFCTMCEILSTTTESSSIHLQLTTVVKTRRNSLKHLHLMVQVDRNGKCQQLMMKTENLPTPPIIQSHSGKQQLIQVNLLWRQVEI